MADLANEEKPAIAPPVFVFQKEKAQKRSAEASSPEDGEDSDKESNYCPPVKRERTSSLTQFPPSNSVSKNNVFMPSNFCQSPTGNSDSEPEEKTIGFRLKPPTLIHGQAPSADSTSGTNGVNKISSSESNCESQNNTEVSDSTTSEEKENENKDGLDDTEEKEENKEVQTESAFVFGQNLKERVKVEESDPSCTKGSSSPVPETQSGSTNYFLQYISTPSTQNAANNIEATGSKFVFGQNMYMRVLSPPKCSDSTTEPNKECAAGSSSELSSQEATPEKVNNVTESLEESAAAYTKATAKKCLLEKVEVITGEEAESNVLQIQCKLFVFDKTTQSWVERGRGLLRLNDMASTDNGSLQSRLVMRTQGSLRLILNTKLWAQMQIDKASEKSIRITAMDTEDQGVKVFLISASSKDTGQLYAALHHRILALRSRAEQEQETKSVAAEPEVTQSNEEDSDEDDVLTPGGSTVASGSTDVGDAPATGST
ncbi:ran-binding protein 3a isoform X2 [Erpetoichthys calabaricus]|uniref:ran-binding protein 3a isoform X2 n=1 Tax=Erpetoichthys calabaricus TaxID=27687 RepID=UPI00109F1C3E|nr:ran-binding protein 3a isoform X2 [Erpetoichthys calabaricus]